MTRAERAAAVLLNEAEDSYSFAKKTFGGRGKVGKAGRGLMDKIGGSVMGGSINRGQQFGAGGESAQFDIVIERLTANIAAALPVFIFGAQHAMAGYAGLLNVPSGMTLQVKMGIIGNTTSNLEFVDFIYTQGANVDTVRVSTNSGAPYPSFLMASLTDLFVINGIRYTISDTTQLGQLNQPFIESEKSLFGKTQDNPISVSSFKNPLQFQSGIIDIPYNGGIDKEKGFAISIISDAGFSVTLSVLVSRFTQLANF